MIASIGIPCSSMTWANDCETRLQRGRERLLDREVEHRLLARRQLDRALEQAADGLGDGEGARTRGARHVAVDAEGGDEPDAFLVAAAHLRAQHAGRDHAHVAGRVEAVERERVPARHDDQRVVARADRQRRDHVVGDEDADDVDVGRRVEVGGGEAVGGRPLARLVGAHADVTSTPESRRFRAHGRPWLP